MRTNIIFGTLVFTSIILLSMFANTNEYFASPDSVEISIQKLKQGYLLLKNATKQLSTKSINTPKGELPINEVVLENITNILTLEKTYNEMINSPQLYDSENIKNTVQKSINELIERYNYIIKTLGLKIPEYKDIKTLNMRLKTATETAISNTKVDPVLVALQTVQDAYISIREEIIRGGSRSINTPKGQVSALKMVEENITGINILTEKYQFMLQDKESKGGAKKYVQSNLDVFITTYNYIIISLNLKHRLLQKNMITMKEEPIYQDKIPEPIPGIAANKTLTIPIAQLFGNQPLITQMSTHGLDAPPNFFSTSVSMPAPTPIVSLEPSSAPKPLPESYFTTKLSNIYGTMATQNSML